LAELAVAEHVTRFLGGKTTLASEIAMRRRFVVAAALLSLSLVSSDASADGYLTPEQPPPAEPPPPYVTVFNWTGAYVGGQVGFAYSDTTFDYAATSLPACAAITGVLSDCQAHGNANSNGLAGGLQAGFNYQSGHFIWGLEGDVTLRGSNAGKAVFLPTFGATQQFTENNDWLITLRPRIGFAYYRAFIYATGGAALSNVSHTIAFQDPSSGFAPLTAHESSTRAGWTLGTGVEYVLASHLTVKGEYLFVDLGSVTVTTPATGGWWATATQFAEQEHILRAGLNYKF
jgi:outer membrane immunogenic protein